MVSGADAVSVVLTHGHRDHAGAAVSLADATGAPVVGPSSVADVTAPIEDGGTVDTDAGELLALHTPGHTEDHLCYHWGAKGALFAGDLLLGQGDTTWVAEYPGCVADYLASLERVRALAPTVIYPAHGPPLEAAAQALDRFEAHRRERIGQTRAAMAEHPDADIEALLDAVYGDTLPRGVRKAARRSLSALVEYVRTHDA